MRKVSKIYGKQMRRVFEVAYAPFYGATIRSPVEERSSWNNDEIGNVSACRKVKSRFLSFNVSLALRPKLRQVEQRIPNSTKVFACVFTVLPTVVDAR